METNQKVIESLLRIVILCGKQGLALGGHRDDRQSVKRSNEGNFVQLLRFKAETDTILSLSFKGSKECLPYFQNHPE